MPGVLEHGYLALPAGEGPAPAILLLPAWWGLTGEFRRLGDELAAEGYLSFVHDLYGGRTAATREQAEVLAEGLDHGASFALLHQQIAALRAHPRSTGQPPALIGFSLGGMLGIGLLSQAPNSLRALLLFYGVDGGFFEFPPLNTPVQGHFAEVDEFDPREAQDDLAARLRAAGASVDFHNYPGTGHWFFEADQPAAFHAEAARLARERSLAFLKAHAG